MTSFSTISINLAKRALVIFTLSAGATNALAIFIDGEGHYALRPETLGNPGFSSKRGLYQATPQSFGLLADVKAGDRLSIKGMFRLFDNPRTAYLGNTPRPRECARLQREPSAGANDDTRYENSQYGVTTDCDNVHQDTNEPAYRSYKPQFTELYVEYAFDYCILEAGRRSRDWGMGIFLDSGRKPFSESASIFDGVTCRINPLNYETQNYTFGIDRLAETGSSVDVNLPFEKGYGPSKSSDDLSQLFLSMEYDDRNITKSSDFARHIGIYAAKIFGTSKYALGDSEYKVKTDVTYADLYTGLYYGKFAARHELLFRLGKTSDPNWSRYGGISVNTNEDPVKSNIDSIAFAGELSLRFGESGSYAGPAEYNMGTAQYYRLFTEYGYAPGDRDGYQPEHIRRERHSNKVRAVAFNRNFKPALILFNGPYELDDMRVDGVFDPGRIMNATYATLGIEYASLMNGTFAAKFVTAQLAVGIPGEVKTNIANEEARRLKQNPEATLDKRPVGYSGTHLGYELDLTYHKSIGKNLQLGAAAAYAIPGAAWRVTSSAPANSYLLQGNVSFTF